MHPSQFKRLLALLRTTSDTLRTGLREIKESSDKQERSIRDTTEACEEKERKQRITIARAIVRAASTVPEYEKTQRIKEHSQQQKMFRVMLGAAVAAAVAAVGAIYYAHIAKQQLDAETRSWVGVAPNLERETDVPYSQSDGKVEIGLRYELINYGHVPARVYIHVTTFEEPSNTINEKHDWSAEIADECRNATYANRFPITVLPQNPHYLRHQLPGWRFR